MFWNEKIECMSREELEELQLKKLQKTVKLHITIKNIQHVEFSQKILKL